MRCVYSDILRGMPDIHRSSQKGVFVNPGLQNPVPICDTGVTKSEFHSTDKKDEGYEGLKGFSNSFIRKTKNKYI